MRFALLLVFCLLVVSACTAPPPRTTAGPCAAITADNSDQCLRLNEIQVLGTHNSYKRAPNQRLLGMLQDYSADLARELNYQHRPLPEQLEELGIRQVELDVFADPEGGLFAEPAGARLTGDNAFLQVPEMQQPGLKVFHVQDIDYRSTCPTFVQCLRQIRQWSVSHPDHLPVMVLVEAKDQVLPPSPAFQYAIPVPFTAANIGELDREIRQVFPASGLITPDDVRGNFGSLEQAVQSRGWPTLAESRGRVLFALDNTGPKRDAYLSRAPGLRGAVLFVSSEPGEPTAGFIKMNDVLADAGKIKEYVAAGYLVRTRADSPGHEAYSGSTNRRDQALASGAQYVSTDYPETSPFGSDYRVTLPGTPAPARCNPVTAPPGCRNDYLRH